MFKFQYVVRVNSKCIFVLVFCYISFFIESIIFLIDAVVASESETKLFVLFFVLIVCFFL